MKKKIIIIGAGGAIILLVIFSLMKGRQDKSDFPEVEWVRASMKPMEETISASGELKPHSKEVLTAQISGRVESFSATEGQWVEQNDLLLTLDSADYRQQVSQAQASLESIRRTLRENLLSYRLEYRGQETSLRQTREKLEKQEELFKLEAITEEELKLSRDALETGQENLRALGAKLNLLCGMPPYGDPLLDDQKDDEIIASSPDVRQQQLLLEGARRNLERCFIRAPRDGQVVKIYPDRGSLVGAGTELIIMQGDDPMEAEITVDEVDIGKLKVGDPVIVKTDSLIGKEISGQITSISPILELRGNVRAGTVTIGMGETGLPLRSGASCVAEITTLARESALTLPAAVISTDRGRILAYRLTETEEGKTRLEELSLETGISTINDLEILKDVAEGDRFALPRGELILRDGLFVIPAGNPWEEPVD